MRFLCGMKTTTSKETVTINFFTGRGKKPWASCEVSEREFDLFRAIAKRRGMTLNKLFLEIICDHLALAFNHPGRQVPPVPKALARLRKAA